jgi:hypothetical protein
MIVSTKKGAIFNLRVYVSVVKHLIHKKKVVEEERD